MAFCSGCGSSVADGTAFCAKCGKPAGQGVGGGAAAAPAHSPAANAGLQDNVAGALAYLLIPAIIFLAIEPYNKNRFIRFHSFQSIAICVVSIVVQSALGFVPIVGWALLPFVSLGFFVLWVFLLFKAFQGQMTKLPVIGDWAETTANN